MDESLLIDPSAHIPHGGYDYDDVLYGDLLLALHSGVLKFCGCGRPEDNVKYVLDGLKIMEETSHLPYRDKKCIRREHFGSGGAEYFFYYTMDILELTEHGGSVPGWVSPEGKEFIKLGELALQLYDPDYEDK